MSSRLERPGTAALAMTLGMFFWGIAWPVGKLAAPYLSPAGVNSFRFASAALALWLIVWRRGDLPRPGAKTSLLLLACGLLASGYFYFFMLGLGSGLAGAGGVLVTTLVPLFTFIITHFFVERRRAIGPGEALGLLAGLSGGALLVAGTVDDFSLAALTASGNAWFLLCALLWSGLTVTSRSVRARLDGIQFNALTLTQVALFSLAVMPASDWEGGLFNKLDWAFAGYILILSWLANVVGTSFFFAVTYSRGAKFSTAFVLLVPVFALVSSAIFLGEELTAPILSGSLLAILGVIFISRGA